MKMEQEKIVLEKTQNDNSSPALILNNIVKVYGSDENKVKALKGVNFSFRRNEFVSILGPSGCGKTTLLNIIGGLDRYTSGDLIIEGKSTKDYKDKDWDAYRNNCIGFVFQSYNLIPHQTVLANVELALELSGVSKKERKERAVEVLKKVGLKDQLNKKPNQLSGGQMQRVAIARALINNPEIILADEPTGALDTETSIQIMELLKEVAKEKLVIMVTHNPELAEKYSTRIIRLLDGEMVGDTNPFNSDKKTTAKVMRKPKMGFRTAFSLSLKNLISKRARTILTSIAGSIGIIGVALVLALSNGFNAYMTRMQTDTLSTYPLTISESSVDLSSFSNMGGNGSYEKFPQTENVLIKKAFDKLVGMLKSNDLTDSTEKGFRHYVESVDSDLYYDISYNYGFDMNDYFYTGINIGGIDSEGNITYPEKTPFMSIDDLVNNIEGMFNAMLQDAMGLNTGFVRQYIPTIQEMPDSEELINSQYDVLKGHLPTNANEMVFVVDEYNGLSDISLALLGYVGVAFNKVEDGGKTVGVNDLVKFDRTNETISFDDIMGKKYYVANNDLMYKLQDGKYCYNQQITADTEGLKELSIVGIIRPKENVNGILSEGFAYSSKLTQEVIEQNKNSNIVKSIKDKSVTLEEGGELTVYSVKGVDEHFTPIYGMFGKFTVTTLAGRETPSSMSIFAKDFESKEKIKSYIDKWNDGQNAEELKITYSDMMGMLFGMLSTMVDAVTYVLVAFTSISLVVSSVMIGIITYISVVERTKEIGVLRALGASKNEISNVFNAETFLIGLFSGVFGVGVTYLLSLLINGIMTNLLPEVGAIANLNPLTALLLVGVSIALTLIAGLIPSRIAAKKDPVVALRSE